MKLVLLGLLGLVLIVMAGMVSAHTWDGGSNIVVPSQEVNYFKDEVVRWDIHCAESWTCTRAVQPGGLFGFFVRTDQPGDFKFVLLARRFINDMWEQTRHEHLFKVWDCNSPCWDTGGPGGAPEEGVVGEVPVSAGSLH